MSYRLRHKWCLDGRNSSDNCRQLQSAQDLPTPVGYSNTAAVTQEAVHNDADASLIVKRSWDIALGPIKQLPMNLFIMFMAGNTISIFPIMMVGMLLFGPIKALLAISSTFSKIVGNQAPLQRFVYFLGNLMGIGVALYKLQSMGLLPTYTSDWLAFQEMLIPVQYVSGGAALS